MASQLPNLDLPPLMEKRGFPWVGLIIGIALVIAAVGWWFNRQPYHQGHATVVAALEKQLNEARTTLDAERDKAVKMTEQLEAMKQDWATGKVADKHQATADYAQLSAARDAQRKKVEALTAQYNEKLANLEKVKQ
jgi:hypothetical protein